MLRLHLIGEDSVSLIAIAAFASVAQDRSSVRAQVGCCTEVQGFYFSPPIPAEQFLETFPSLPDPRNMDISALQTKLPDVCGWIDTTLQHYRHIARPVISLGFARLPNYFELETLNRAFVVVLDTVPMPPLAALGLHQFEAFERMEADGVTYKDTYFVRRELATDESLHFHELLHILQWRALGPEQFILAYALELAKRGYSANPFEQIAYALEERFSRDEKPFCAEALIKGHMAQALRMTYQQH